MKTFIELAGKTFVVDSIYGGFSFFCQDFLVDSTDTAYPISVNEMDLDHEWKYEHDNPIEKNSIQRKSMNPVLERKAILRKIVEILPGFSVMLMHGAVVCNGDDAYMFTAPSGEGKTTRAHLFLETHPNSFILNGDKPFIKVMKDRVLVYSSPWKGKEDEGVNAFATLKAIFLLERHEHTILTELNIQEAFDFLLSQTCMPSKDENAKKVLELLHSMQGKVRVFRYQSPPTEESVNMAIHAANN